MDKNMTVDQASRGVEKVDGAIASLDAAITALKGHLAAGRPLPAWLYGRASKALVGEMGSANPLDA